MQRGISTGALSALVAADAALHRGLVRDTDLRRAVQAVDGHPHSAMIGVSWTVPTVAASRLVRRGLATRFT